MAKYACSGVVGGIVVAVLLALCLCFFLRRKRNKQVGEKHVAAKQQKAKRKQQKEKKASGPWLGFLRRKKGGPGTGKLKPCSCSRLLDTLAPLLPTVAPLLPHHCFSVALLLPHCCPTVAPLNAVFRHGNGLRPPVPITDMAVPCSCWLPAS